MKKRPGQFFLKVPILIPYMVRIIQANFKKWPTIVIIDNILAGFQGPYRIYDRAEFFKKWVSLNDLHPTTTSICQTFWPTIVIIVLAGAPIKALHYGFEKWDK